MEGWGLAPARLHETNPGLIVVRMSGYGQSGPYAGRAGFGGIGEAMGGWRNIVGEADRPPARMGVSIGDPGPAERSWRDLERPFMRLTQTCPRRPRGHCRAEIAGYKLPRSLQVVLETPVPRSAAGKVLKTDLRAPWWEGREKRV